MGGHRGGRSRTKRASTSPARVDRSKLTKRLCNSPPSIEPTVKKGRQRSATASPVPDEESLSGESYLSDSTSTSSLSNRTTNSTHSPILSEENADNSPSSSKKPAFRIPPIIVSKSSDWRRAAPIIFSDPILSPEIISAQATSDGSIIIKTREISHYRLIQKMLIEQNIQFVTSKLPDERTLKVVLKGVPTDISTDEIQCELESLNFDVKLVKRFGPVNKPMPICLVIIGLTSKHIYEITDLFYVKVSVETYKKSGPSQCFACQRIGHGSSNCTHPLRCVKCSGEHKASQCPKTIDQDPTCCNCGGKHTANYRGCPYLAQAANSKLAKNPQPNPSHPTDQPIQSHSADTTKVDYASATKSKKTLSSEQVIELLTDLLSVLSTSDDPKSMLISTIKSFITLFANQQ